MTSLHLGIPLLAMGLALAPGPASAGPKERVERLIAASRYEDAIGVARAWIERHPEPDGDLTAMQQNLAEAEYRRLSDAPSISAADRWLQEFGDSAHGEEVRSLAANLRLYAAAEAGTEAAYLEVAEGWVGTAAAVEARARAEAIAFRAAKEDGGAETLEAFLDQYRGMAHTEEALDLWRAATWDRASREDSAASWRDLRLRDPEHPMAPEALLREQQLALEDLGAESSPGELLKLARRYPAGPAGWEALQRATDRAILRASDIDGSSLHEEPLGAGLGPAAPPLPLGPAARLELVFGGRLPRGAAVTVAVDALLEEGPQPWSRAAFRQAARWGVRSDPAVPTSPDAFTTDKPLCRGDLLQAAQVRVRLSLGEHSASWTRPIDLQQPCAGPLPWAARRVDGQVVGLRSPKGQIATDRPIFGLDWACDGPLLADLAGVEASCAGHALLPLGGGILVRPAPPGPARYEDEFSPWLDDLEGDGWRAVDVPDAWHFGDRPRCPSGASPAVEPISPPWLPGGVTTWLRDVDGDGIQDLVAAHGEAGGGQLALVGAGLPAGAALVIPWPPGLDPASATVLREGCGLLWRRAP